MKKISIIILSILIIPMATLSAEDKKKDTFVYATYLNCDTSSQSDADTVMEKEFAAVYDKAVSNKVISSWSWLKHHTGGQWRRVSVNTVQGDINDLLNAQDKLGELLDAAKVDPNNIYASACNSHDDYIWKLEEGQQTEKPNSATLSVYMECNMADEDRADEIVSKIFTPIYNANMGKGKLTSWGWLSHIVGGKYRRLLTMSAANYTDLLNTRNNILDTIYGDKGPAEAKEMSQICTSHSDYLWDR